ncbi:MAG: ABC transporter permease [Halobacteriaceae archaeon]
MFGLGRVGRFDAAVAVALVQVLAFAAAYVADVPTAYAVFALVSAVAVAAGSGRGAFETVLAAFGTALLLALGLPLLMLAARQDPDLVAEMATRPGVQQALYLSIYGPLLAALAATVTGVPLAYLLSRGFPGQAAVASLVDLPLVVPHSVVGIMVLFAFGSGGAFPGVDVFLTMAGLVLAMAFVSAPYVVNAAREGFEATDGDLERASRSLGASQFESFRRVEWPLARRAVLTGALLSWARAVSEFGAVAVIAYNVEFFYPLTGRVVTGQHAPVLIHNTFLSEGLAESGAVSALLLSIVAVVFLVIRGVAYDDDESGGLPQ